jgi:hypothetical protein
MLYDFAGVELEGAVIRARRENHGRVQRNLAACDRMRDEVYIGVLLRFAAEKRCGGG